MEISPQRVRSAEFKTVRKGADPDEVRLFLDDVASELERAQNQATAMEARARAAVARLQEATEEAASAPPPAPAVDASVEESETISRTLLLAQRTADGAVAEAQAKASSIVAQAKEEAAKTLDSTREMTAQMVEEARVEARQEGVAERESVAGEVEALKARRDFLESDVHHLETFLADQRARVRDAGTSLIGLADRVPDGLGPVRPPLLSASDDEDAVDDDVETPDIATDAEDLVIVTEIADDSDAVVAFDEVPEVDDRTDDAVVDEQEQAPDLDRDLDRDPWADAPAVDDPTEAIPVLREEPARDDAASDGGDDDEFRFSFDDDRT